VALGFGAKGEEDVIALISKKNYAKAIEVLKKGKADPRAKMQLADVLVLSGKPREAVAVLAPLADEYAREGFAAKAVAVLKKIQKIDPTRRDTEQKLASLIQEKQRVATISLPSATSGGGLPEIGIEEIGMEPPPGLDRDEAGRPSLSLGMDAGPELGMEGPAATAGPAAALPELALPLAPAPEPVVPVPVVPAPVVPLPVPVAPAAVEATAAAPPPLVLESEPLALDLGPPVPSAPAPAPLPLSAPAAPAPPPAALAPKPAPLVDTDFFTEEDLQLTEPEALSAEPLVEAEVAVEAEIAPEPVPADPMTDARFADELMGLVDSLFDSSATAAQAANEPAAPEAGQQIVVSPLFAALSVDEMVAVIAGLNLLIVERGDVIIRQGQPGNSLYMLTSGKVRAFVKKDGKNVPVADLSEGAFFGEGSILTGKPRSATVAALTTCELLELDRPTLDDITSRHPHVMDVMREFAARRIK
jgi:hypothetical protein